MKSHDLQGISNHQHFDYLFNSFLILTLKKHQRLSLLALCEGNPPVVGVVSFISNRIRQRNRNKDILWISALIARFMGPTWGPSGANRTHVGPMLAPWTLLSGSTRYIEALLHSASGHQWSLKLVASHTKCQYFGKCFHVMTSSWMYFPALACLCLWWSKLIRNCGYVKTDVSYFIVFLCKVDWQYIITTGSFEMDMFVIVFTI